MENLTVAAVVGNIAIGYHGVEKASKLRGKRSQDKLASNIDSEDNESNDNEQEVTESEIVINPEHVIPVQGTTKVKARCKLKTFYFNFHNAIIFYFRNTEAHGER